MKWSELSMTQKADVISMAVKAGIKDLNSIKSFYNESVGSSREYKKGGYLDWKEKASNYKHLDIDNDNTYDYEGWYNENPERAWNLLKDDPNAHFDDRYKTVYHPTFSTQSKYSGVRDVRFNPQGLIGGTWSEDGHTFIMSPDGYRGPVSMDERKAYLEDAEDYGVQLREANGSLPIYDNTVWGGVLPNVTIRPRRFEYGGYTKTYTDSMGRKVPFPRKFRETDEQYEARYAERVAMGERNAAANKARFERRIAANKAGAARLNRAINTVTNVMEEQAKATPFTGQEIQQAAEEQRQEKLDKWGDYKKGINATITAAELGLSGASLLGAYANWKNWATAANATKRGIANLLQRAQLPMQVGGTLIDGYQTYDALQNNDNYNANYNGISTGLGVAGSVGASDIFLNSRFHSPKVDRVLDAMGVIQNSGDFIKFGYDSMFGNERADGGSIHIAPSKRGTFTAAASKHGMGVQEFASKVLAHPENYSLTMRKKANFARNASKWKHGEGGNLYGKGGFVSLITTPVLPNVTPVLPDVKEIRRRLYNGVNPVGYQHIPKRIWEALNGKEAKKSIYRDDQWATYLQIPEEERHQGVEKLKPARYKPSKGASEGDIYRVTLNNEDTDSLIKSVQLFGLNIGENTVDRSLSKYFGDHTIGRGYDKKGEYVSYYDKYDLNPFVGGTPIKTGVKKVGKWLRDNTSNIDMSMGIGKPFEIYDRIYLDDYYEVPKEARGATFLPEVIVTGKKKKALGGNLFEGGGNRIVTTGGAGYVPPVSEGSLNKFKEKVVEASKKAMFYAWDTRAEGFKNPFTYDWSSSTMDNYESGTAQDTFLLPRKLQEEQFLKAGYIKGEEGDYGLVKKAVGKHNYPVYQTAPDAISRDKLIVLGNTYTSFLDHDIDLKHEGSAPSAIYTDGHGNFYQKRWDLNDYGGSGGSTASIAGRILDAIGSPTVITTGYQPFGFTDKHPYYVHDLKPMMAKKGLVPIEIDGKTEWTLPEVTVVGKRKKQR